MSFFRYEGCGNSFLLFDRREEVLPHFSIQALCAAENVDGIVFLEKSTVVDFRMRIFNRDGSLAHMCGNALRCLVKFIERLEGRPRECYRIETDAGLRDGWVLPSGLVKVSMGHPKLMQTIDKGIIVDTGVPHALFFHSFSSVKEMKAIRDKYNANVSSVEVLSPSVLKIETYERGVEGVTGACGTGAVAAAWGFCLKEKIFSDILVYPPSGLALKISFQQREDGVCSSFLTGEVKALS